MVKYWFPVHGTSRRSGTFTSEDGPKEDLITVHKHLRLQAPPTRGYLRLLDYNLIIPSHDNNRETAGPGSRVRPSKGSTSRSNWFVWERLEAEEERRKNKEKES